MALRRTLTGAVALGLLLSGCGEDPPSEDDAPRSMDCGDARPRWAGPEGDDGDGADLVPADRAAVAMVLCTFPLGGPGEQDRPPTSSPLSADDIAATVPELNGFPPLRDPDEHVCNAAMWPGFVLLVEHANGAVTALTVDLSCGLVSDGEGAVRIGIPDVAVLR